jgi:hypothetical protein
VTLQSESAYYWEAEHWTVPIGLFASQVLKVGGQPFSLQFVPHVFVDGPSSGPACQGRLFDNVAHETIHIRGVNPRIYQCAIHGVTVLGEPSRVGGIPH